MAINLIQLFGAASNDKMDEAERERVIQTSVERMGPMFIKVMQSLVNMESLIRQAAPETLDEEADPVIRSLAKLQDEVTPVPWFRVEKRIRESLELKEGEPLEDRGEVRGRFVSIDKKAIKSGSIGQLHRAKIRVERDGEEEVVDCVVKVLRPGVEEAFESTVRATRLTLSLIRELLHLDRDGDIFGELKEDIEGRLPLIERALNGFIESFRVETDFAVEVENLRAFEKLHAADPFVVVPEVFDSHTKNGVLTMQELKGFKLSTWVDRYQRAASAQKLAEDMGRVPKGGAEERAAIWASQTLGIKEVTTQVLRRARRMVVVRVSGRDASGREVVEQLRIRTKSGAIHAAGTAQPTRPAAEDKARLFAEKTWGLPVTGVTSIATGDGVRCRVELDDPTMNSAEIFVANDGKVSTTTTLPDLSSRGAAALRDRLRTVLMVQLIQGFLHGDPHEGNFFVMPDGVTVGLIDFGLALDVGLLDAKGPINLLAGAMLEDPRQMAEAMFQLSTARDLEGDAREEALKPLVEFFGQLSGEISEKVEPKKSWLGRMKQRFSKATTVVRRSLEAIQAGGLIPLPRVIHGLKALFAMSSNIAKLAPFDERTPSKRRTLSLASRAWVIHALAPFVGRRAVEKKRRRMDAIAPVDVPRYVEQRSRGPPELKQSA